MYRGLKIYASNDKRPPSQKETSSDRYGKLRVKTMTMIQDSFQENKKFKECMNWIQHDMQQLCLANDSSEREEVH